MEPYILALLMLQDPTLTNRDLPPCAGVIIETEDSILCIERNAPFGSERRDPVVIRPEQLRGPLESEIDIRGA